MRLPWQMNARSTDTQRLLEPENEEELLRGWLIHAHKAAAVQVEAYTEGAIQGHYNTSTLADLLITAPPVPEQQRIVRRVQEESDRVTALRDSVTKALSLLREYRTALISAAVTGQIDVSNPKAATR